MVSEVASTVILPTSGIGSHFPPVRVPLRRRFSEVMFEFGASKMMTGRSA